jgi:tetratricopeptide (TPR) repeat protein
MVTDSREMLGGTRQRPSLRRTLWRWLTGPVELAPDPGPVPVAPPPSGPAATSADQRQRGQAERCYAYAEQLNDQGSADLAVAFYRQAYVQLRGSLGLHGAPQGWQPALPAAATPPAAPALPAPASGTTSPLAQQLEPLKQRLNAATAPEVEQELRRWLAAGHRDADLLNLLGLAALLQEHREEAERWFRETLAIYPDHLRALVNLGGLCLAADRSEEALQHLGRAVRHVPPRSTEGLVALTNLSLAHQNLGRPMDAAQLALRIFRIKPDHLRPESLVATAATLEEMGEDAAAIEILQYLRRHAAGTGDLLRRLAKLLERRGDFQEAALVYRELLNQPDGQPDPQKA